MKLYDNCGGNFSEVRMVNVGKEGEKKKRERIRSSFNPNLQRRRLLAQGFVLDGRRLGDFATAASRELTSSSLKCYRASRAPTPSRKVEQTGLFIVGRWQEASSMGCGGILAS